MIKAKRVHGGESVRQDVCVLSESGIRTYQRHTVAEEEFAFWGIVKIKWRKLKLQLLACALKLFLQYAGNDST